MPSGSECRDERGAVKGRPARALIAAALTLAACTQLPVYTPLSVSIRPSPNFGERRPNYVILHHTTNNNADRALTTLTSPITQVSAHYLIGRDGRLFYLVDERLRAWHAGESYWGGNRDLNSSSIGIELDNNGSEPFAEAQIATLLALLADLAERWRIPAANVVGHGDIAPGRKVDPNGLFPWQRLAQHGFGLWCDPPYDAVPAGVADEMLLAAFGYDVSRPAAAIGAFRRHFNPGDDAPELSAPERGMLACMIRKRQQEAE